MLALVSGDHDHTSSNLKLSQGGCCGWVPSCNKSVKIRKEKKKKKIDLSGLEWVGGRTRERSEQTLRERNFDISYA